MAGVLHNARLKVHNLFCRQFYYLLHTHYFYLFGEHLWKTYHVTNNGLDTGPTKMHKM